MTLSRSLVLATTLLDLVQPPFVKTAEADLTVAIQGFHRDLLGADGSCGERKHNQHVRNDRNIFLSQLFDCHGLDPYFGRRLKILQYFVHQNPVLGV